MNVGYSIGLPLRLAASRFRRFRRVADTLPIAFAFAGIVALLGVASMVRDLTMSTQLRSLPPEERVVTVVVSPETRPTPEQRRAYDNVVRRLLNIDTISGVTRVVLFRELVGTNGVAFRLAGTEALSAHTALISGRMPTSCSGARCEVVVVQRGPTSPPIPRRTDLVVVGTVRPAPSFPFVGELEPTTQETLLLSGTPDAVHTVASLELIRRVDAWTAPILAKSMTQAAARQLLDRTAAIRTDIDSPGVSVRLPDSDIADALERSSRSGRNLAIPASQLGVLLVGAAGLAALLAQREYRTLAGSLERRGAERNLVRAVRWASAGLSVLIGMAIGVVAGVVGTAAIATITRLDVATHLRSLVQRSSLLIVGGSTLALVVAFAAILAYRSQTPVTRRRPVRPVDLGVALAVLAVVIARTTTSNTISNTTTSPGRSLAWLWPIVAAIVVSWWVIRGHTLVAIALRGTRAHDRVGHGVGLVKSNSIAGQYVSLAAMTLAVLSIGGATFAVSSAATLRRNVEDQASWVSPLGARFTIGRTLVRPATVQSSAQWRGVKPDVVFTDVLRRSVQMLADPTEGTLEVVGIDASALVGAPHWPNTPSPSDVARALRSKAPAAVGAEIPRDATNLELIVRGELARLAVAGVVERRDGTWHEIAATQQPNEIANNTVLAATDASITPYRLTLEPADVGGRFLGLRVGLSSLASQQSDHQVGEGGTSFGTAVELDLLRVDAVAESAPQTRRPLDVDLKALGSDQARVTVRDRTLQIRAAIEGGTALVLPGLDGSAVPVVVDRRTAQLAGGVGESFVVETQGRRTTLRVVEIANGFPTVEKRFVIGNRALLAREFDLGQPGSGVAGEMWVGPARGSTARGWDRVRKVLSGAPFDQLDLADHSAIRRELLDDPIRRTTGWVLIVGAALGLALACAALIRGSRFEVDDRTPLRRALRVHAVSERRIRDVMAGAAGRRVAMRLPVGVLAGLVTLLLVKDDLGVGAQNAVTSAVQSIRAVVPFVVVAAVVVSALMLFALAIMFGARRASRISDAELLRDNT